LNPLPRRRRYDVYAGLPTTTAGMDPGIKFTAVYDFSDNPNVTVITSSTAALSGSSTATTTTANYQTTNTGAPAALRTTAAVG
jgi:hypothetical protein